MIGSLGENDIVKEKKLFSFIKIPEPFKKGDIVCLKHPEFYKKNDDVFRYGINLYEIVSMRENIVRLAGVDKDVPQSELLPVIVDGVEDRWIYYDPIIAASIVFPGEPIPLYHTDYSYYMDAFEKNYEGGKTYKELIMKEHLLYVHEIQHYLRREYGADNLKINDSMNR